uniref:GCS light chain n=1 Tax=Ciona savignyi TaxID=51511 RepID=H2YV83_CIOSA
MCDVERTQILSDAKSMTIHSGNVLYKLVMSVDEICASFCSQIKSWLNDKQAITNSEDIFIGEKFPDDTEDRKEIKITVKVFLRDLNPLLLQEAIDTVLKSSKISYIDSVLLSLPSNVAEFKFPKLQLQINSGSMEKAGAIRSTRPGQGDRSL